MILLATLEPLGEGLLTLSGWSSGDESGDTDVLIERRPVDSLAAPDEAPFRAFFSSAVGKARIPRDRHGHRATIAEVDRQRVVRHGDIRRHRCQEQGYLVLRFLAEDVLRDLDHVLDSILRSLALRRVTVIRKELEF